MEKAGKLWCDFARHLAEGVQDKFHSQNLSVQICTKPLYFKMYFASAVTLKGTTHWSSCKKGFRK